MQVSCGTCQLSFDAPDGAAGLVCPICRGPLLPKTGTAAGDAAAATAQSGKVTEWSGGDLDDLIAILSAPAVSARVEAFGPSGEAALGEVHLLAGGVAEAMVAGKSTDDALDRLRAMKPTRFRIEQRLPNPADGDLTFPGPESGTLDGRALAHLMRYCEDYVITCSIEVWRGNENARVEYRRGEISGVTVGGIDAPERLAEVMQWSSGNYRLVVPPIKLPTTAPKKSQAPSATPAPVPAPAASAQAARQSSATKTIFGMPAAEVMKARAAAEAAKTTAASAPAPAPAPAATAAPTPATAAPPSAAAAPPPAAAPRITPPGVAPSYVTPPVSAQQRTSATKTMFGVPAPELPAGFAPGQPSPVASAAPGAPLPAEPAASPTAPTPDIQESQAAHAARVEAERKMGARKVSVPAPEISPPAVAADAQPEPFVDGDPRTSTQAGFEPAPTPEKERKRPSAPAPAAAPAAVSRPAAPEAPARRETPIWAYIGVGVTFGLVLLGVYELVGLLGH